MSIYFFKKWWHIFVFLGGKGDDMRIFAVAGIVAGYSIAKLTKKQKYFCKFNLIKYNLIKHNKKHLRATLKSKNIL